MSANLQVEDQVEPQFQENEEELQVEPEESKAEEIMESTGEGQQILRANQKRKRRSLNQNGTLERFRNRISMLSTEVLREKLEDKYILTYDVWDTLMDLPEAGQRPTNAALILWSIAKERGVHVLGVASSRKRKGSYVNPVPSGKQTLFIGSSQYFTGYTRDPIFSVQPADKVYL